MRFAARLFALVALTILATSTRSAHADVIYALQDVQGANTGVGDVFFHTSSILQPNIGPIAVTSSEFIGPDSSVVTTATSIIMTDVTVGSVFYDSIIVNFNSLPEAFSGPYIPTFWGTANDAGRITGSSNKELLILNDPSLGASPVPEPSELVLIGTGLVGFAGAAERRFRRQ